MSTKHTPKFYACGICDHYHPATWDGDCRDDQNRWTVEQLDRAFGVIGWTEVDTPPSDAIAKAEGTTP